MPALLRPEKAEPHRQQILELLSTCKGNLVRVQEELAASGVNLSYSTLTAFCRRHGIGQPPAVAVGRYEFLPGEEMQHDTSPHELELAGKRRKVQTASAVLAYSRMLFFQMYPSFQRFDCKVFLTEALRYFNGAPQRAMIDNTHVVVLRGTGREMVPVPEMAAFAERFGFRFVAHERGHANRSARVERPFWFIETNFLAGRSFASWQDLNQQARQWCDRVNATYKKYLRAVPRELFVLEQHASAPPAGLDPRGLSLAPTPGGRGRLRRAAQQPLLRAPGLARPARGSTRNQGPSRDPTRCPQSRHPPAHRRGRTAAHHCWRNTVPREDRATRAPILIPRKRSFSKLRRNSPTTSPRSSNAATNWSSLPCANCCAWCASIPANRCWPPSRESARYGLYDLDRVERMILRRVARDYFLLDDDPGGNDEDQ